MTVENKAMNNDTQAVIEEVKVAVAVIYYQQQFLLGYRNAKQHQGERYEFIGGKMEAQETPLNALKREVKEEIGLVINEENSVTKLGDINHDYRVDNSDKSTIVVKRVWLHVYQIHLTSTQYKNFQQQSIGCEGQPLLWVSKSDLINNKYPLPEANQLILTWLSH